MGRLLKPSLMREDSTFKRILKLLLSLLLSCADAVRDGFRKVAGRGQPSTCVILYYHSIPASQRGLFARQMDLLLRCAKPARADSLQRREHGRSAVVTFDDGFENVLVNAVPELAQRNIPATIFVVSERLGTSPAWEHFGPNAGPGERLMTLNQLLDLPANLITIGSHSKTHPRLTKLAPAEARREIGESRSQLEQLLQRPVKLFSFPYGDCSRELVKSCRETGYERVFTIAPMLVNGCNNSVALGRVEADPTDWPVEFRLKVAGAYRWLAWGGGRLDND